MQVINTKVVATAKSEEQRKFLLQLAFTLWPCGHKTEFCIHHFHATAQDKLKQCFATV